MTRPRRWLIITPYFAPEIGAAAIRLHALARQLVRRGYSVEVLTASPSYPTGRVLDGYRNRVFAREERDGISIVRTWTFPYHGPSALLRVASYLTFSVCAFAVCPFLPRPDLVFIEAKPITLGLAATLLRVLFGTPYVYNVSDLQTEAAAELGFVRSPLLLKAARALDRYLMRHAFTVSTVTRTFIDRVVATGVARERVSFLPNGADTAALRPQGRDGELARELGVDGKKVFVYAGTHAYYHGSEVIVEAAARLRDNDDIVFLLIGRGPQRGHLEAMARDLPNVVFRERPFERMAEVYSFAYASIATVRDIPVARGMRLAKIFPSLSCGVPVVYSGRGEGAELMVENRCGVAVTPEAPVELASAIEALAADPSERDLMGARGRELAVREYDWSTIVTAWLRSIGLE
jgi:colanic acid biosynthesis glycosyl transferase WcaI